MRAIEIVAVLAILVGSVGMVVWAVSTGLSKRAKWKVLTRSDDEHGYVWLERSGLFGGSQRSHVLIPLDDPDFIERMTDAEARLEDEALTLNSNRQLLTR